MKINAATACDSHYAVDEDEVELIYNAFPSLEEVIFNIGEQLNDEFDEVELVNEERDLTLKPFTSVKKIRIENSTNMEQEQLERFLNLFPNAEKQL